MIAFEGKSSAAWLSISKGDEVIAHEWDTTTALESQWLLGRLANSRVISKVASNGVFFLDPEEKTLSFKPLGPPTLSRPHLRLMTWDLPDVEKLHSDQPGRLAISADGNFVALWGWHGFWVLLVDVSNDVYHWAPLVKSPNLSDFPRVLKVCFSPDETRLAILSSERT